ncbi:rhodanese-like domain-containing protein [uncultured Tenacibaculum sp.]|uniref:rhodanese-like domain-containing protein n=1 Tax=uncultured Tenacibaculum sp. TaxID=174713 RepID=UPI00262242E0|nr:rhodanese-like domain-containing protein [uncultured Tenacibaculum sp.]
MKKVILWFMCISIFISCSSSSDEIQTITVDKLQEIIIKDRNIQILDVRTSTEASDGVIFNAIQVNLVSGSFKSKAIDLLDKEKPVYVYCKSGRRSKIAAGILYKNGYDVFNVRGGYVAWEKKMIKNINKE